MNQDAFISRDPDVMSGTPVFRGTRVPARTLFDYLSRGAPLAEFLDDFPTVSREAAVAVLRESGELVVALSEETAQPTRDTLVR
jgi:uncharacterized protein (DUF433 family)